MVKRNDRSKNVVGNLNIISLFGGYGIYIIWFLLDRCTEITDVDKIEEKNVHSYDVDQSHYYTFTDILKAKELWWNFVKENHAKLVEAGCCSFGVTYIDIGPDITQDILFIFLDCYNKFILKHRKEEKK